MRFFQTLGFICLFLLMGARFQQSTLTIKGSDTMVILVQRWTEVYPDKNVSFQVTGGEIGRAHV